MRINGARTVPMVIAVVYAYGVVLGIVGLGISWLNGRGIPQLEWWELAVAPFVIGAVAAAIEALGTFLLGGFTFGKTESRGRVIAGKIVFVFALVAILVGWPIYHLSQQ